MSTLLTLTDVVDDIFDMDGGTFEVVQYDFSGWRLRTVHRTSGYFVAERGREHAVPTFDFTEVDLDWYISYHVGASGPTRLLGAWIDNGIVHLDVSHHFETLSHAVQFGLRNDQLAIWDCDIQKSIWLTDLTNEDTHGLLTTTA